MSKFGRDSDFCEQLRKLAAIHPEFARSFLNSGMVGMAASRCYPSEELGSSSRLIPSKEQEPSKISNISFLLKKDYNEESSLESRRDPWQEKGDRPMFGMPEPRKEDLIYSELNLGKKFLPSKPEPRPWETGFGLAEPLSQSSRPLLEELAGLYSLKEKRVEPEPGFRRGRWDFEPEPGFRFGKGLDIEPEQRSRRGWEPEPGFAFRARLPEESDFLEKSIISDINNLSETTEHTNSVKIDPLRKRHPSYDYPEKGALGIAGIVEPDISGLPVHKYPVRKGHLSERQAEEAALAIIRDDSYITSEALAVAVEVLYAKGHNIDLCFRPSYGNIRAAAESRFKTEAASAIARKAVLLAAAEGRLGYLRLIDEPKQTKGFEESTTGTFSTGTSVEAGLSLMYDNEVRDAYVRRVAERVKRLLGVEQETKYTDLNF